VEIKKPQPNIITSTSNSSAEDKILGPEIVNLTPGDQDVQANAQNYSTKSNADNGIEPNHPVEEKQNVSKCPEFLTPQGPPANERKAEGPFSKGNPKLSKQSKPPIGTLISSRLPPSSSNWSKPRSSKQQQVIDLKFPRKPLGLGSPFHQFFNEFCHPLIIKVNNVSADSLVEEDQIGVRGEDQSRRK
jgi:hypothetical protein